MIFAASIYISDTAESAPATATLPSLCTFTRCRVEAARVSYACPEALLNCPRCLMDASAATLELTEAIVAEHSRLRIPSRPEWIPNTIDFLKRKAQLCGACHESRVGKLSLALHEALTNAVIHGNLEVPSALKEREDDSFARILAERAADPYYAERSVFIDIDQDSDRSRWRFTDEGP